MDFSGRFQKAVFSMQREVANENAFEYFEPTTSRSKRSLDSSGPLYTSYTRRRTLAEKLGDMQKIIEIAVNGTDTEFARSIFAKSLFVYIKARSIPYGCLLSIMSTWNKGGGGSGKIATWKIDRLLLFLLLVLFLM